MTVRCKSCGAQNPAGNRFCGQCGTGLASIDTPAETPEDFCRSIASPTEPFAASSDHPPELADFENVLRDMLAFLDGVQTTTAAPQSSSGVSESDHHKFPEVGEETVPSEVPVAATPASPTAELTTVCPSSTTERPSSYLAEVPASATGEPSDGAESETGGPSLGPYPSSRPFLTGVSGPSFLGLSDDPPPDYLLEPEPKSHLGINLALLVLAVVAALAAFQWRWVRDRGIDYAQNGSMQIKQLASGAPQNPPAVAADHTSRDLGLISPNAQSGSAKAVESSPNADRTLEAQPSAKSAQAAPVPPAAAPTPQKTARLSASERPTAMSAPTRDVPLQSTTDDDQTASRQRVTAAAPTSRETTLTARNVPRAAAPGADEMNRAFNASDSEARAAWLWRAVSKGNPQASVELAKMYERGDGVVRNCVQAEVLLRSAASKGNEQARFSLQQIRIHGGCSVR